MDTYTPPQTIDEHTRRTLARELSRYYHELAGSDEKPAPRFSLARTLDCMAHPTGLRDGFEKELCSATALSAGHAHDPHRVRIPLQALSVRDLSATNGGMSGGYLIETTNAGQPFDVLRAWSVAVSAGITVLPNLVGNLVVPRIGTASTAAWVAGESGTITESQPALGQTALTPKTAAVTVDFSRQWRLQSGVGAELLLRQQLLGAVAALLDKAILAGSGASGEPLGIVNTANVGTQAGASFAHAGAIAMRQTALAAGAREEALRWIAPPAVQGLLAARERSTGGGRFIWDRREILDAPAHATTYAPASTLICGDFSKLLLGIWGPPSLVLEVNPFQDFTRGGMAARVVLMCDVALPQPGAFVVASSLT